MAVFRRAGGIWALVFLAWPGLAPAWGQSRVLAPSQVTPRDLRPRQQPEAQVALPAAAGLTAPPGAARLPVTLSRVVVQGGFPTLADTTAALAATLTGRPATVADVYALANAVEQAYAAAGYVLVRVVVPPQRLERGGTLTLAIVDGFIDAVDVGGVPERQRGLVAARMEPLVGRRRVTLGAIERALMIASEIPGLSLRSTLAKGTAEGGVTLVLDGRHDAITGAVGFDDHLPAVLGTFALNASASANSAFGFGEQVYGSVASGARLDQALDGRSPLKVLSGGISVPLGIDGALLNAEYTRSQTRPEPIPGVPDSQGTLNRFALRASYAAIRTYTHALTLQATVEQDAQEMTLLGLGTLYRDRYVAGRLSADDRMQLPWSVLAQGGLGFSQGLGGRDRADALATGVPLSRFGATPWFTKMTGGLKLSRPILDDLVVSVGGRMQSTFGKPVFVSEEMSLDGSDTLTGWPSGTFSVDSGLAGRAEVSRVVAWMGETGRITVAPYVFGALGRGFLVRPTIVQHATTNAGSFGIGLRAAPEIPDTPRGAMLALEYARTYADQPGLAQGHRVTVSAGLRF